MADETILEGIVLSGIRDRLTVRVETPLGVDDCRCCAAKGLCNPEKMERFDMSATIPDAGRLAPGEAVRLACSAPPRYLGPMAMFFPSLFGLLFGGIFANRFLGDGDAKFLFGTFMGLLGGLALSFVLCRQLAVLLPRVRLLLPEKDEEGDERTG
ncbi:MAG: SoxR reducing system RseC family protein [Planctomycetota bacterium]|nr:SoxR reducing system RseC family protein [Planctomycetota bacterium]